MAKEMRRLLGRVSGETGYWFSLLFAIVSMLVPVYSVFPHTSFITMDAVLPVDTASGGALLCKALFLW